VDPRSRLARDVPVAFIDLEMTGLDPASDRVCEVAVVRTEGERVVTEYQALVKSDVKMSAAASRVCGITDAMLIHAPPFARVASEVAALIDGAVVVSHNVTHDFEFLYREFELAGTRLPPPITVDTLVMARRLFAFPKNNLPIVAGQLGIPVDGQHRALHDARITFVVWRRMLEVLDPNGNVTVGELIDLLSALAPNSPLRLEQQRVLREAFHRHLTVFVDYASTDAAALGWVRREVAIWRLKLPYVQGWCYHRQAERVFRLDRMRTVTLGERAYDIPPFQPRI
jgi:DNA polymerase III epsilon subunit family exonuclease